jgi:hypothetical protein
LSTRTSLFFSEENSLFVIRPGFRRHFMRFFTTPAVVESAA